MCWKALYFRPTNSGQFLFVKLGAVDTINQRVDFSGVSLVDGYFTLGTAVPEPSTLTLLGLSCLGLAVRTRRRRRHAD